MHNRVSVLDSSTVVHNNRVYLGALVLNNNPLYMYSMIQ